MRKTLTALACERHQFGTLSDAHCPGLRLVATPKKRSGIYRYRLHTGQLHQFKLGEFPRMTLAEARVAWAEQKKIRDSVIDPRQEKVKRIEAEVAKGQAAYNVEEMAADWIQLHATRLARGNHPDQVRRADQGRSGDKAQAHGVRRQNNSGGSAESNCYELDCRIQKVCRLGRLPRVGRMNN